MEKASFLDIDLEKEFPGTAAYFDAVIEKEKALVERSRKLDTGEG